MADSDLRRSVEAFLFGLLVTAPFFVIQVVSPPESLQGSTGDLLLIPWALFIVAGVSFLGRRRNIPTLNLLTGSLLGLVSGCAVFASLVGWDIVTFAVSLILAVPIILGTWTSYELNRRREDVEEPPYISWRIVFILILLLPLAILYMMI